MSISRRLDAVVFDIDGVLVEVRFPTVLRETLGISSVDAAEFFDGPFRRCLVGAADISQVIPPFLEKWRWPGSFQEFLDFWFHEESHVNQPLLAAVDELRSHGLKCYLASTQEHHRAAFLEQLLGVGTRFEQAFFSCRLECRKPDPAFFLAASKAIGLPSHRILLLDDDPANVESAASVGWRAAQYRAGDNINGLLHVHGLSIEC